METLHVGTTLSSKTGDFSDVKVVSPYREIEWSRLSRINDKEMRMLMLSIEHALEMALLYYETLDDSDKNNLILVVDKRRSYDLDYYAND